MDLISAQTRKHVRAGFSGKYDSQQLDFLASTISARGAKTSPVLRKGIFGYMQKHGLIEVKTTLTEKGRWVAIAYGLHISFFTLAALTDFYCMQKATGFAVSPKFLERFEPYYSAKYLANTVSVLAQQGIIYSTQKRVWRIKADIFRRLQKDHDGDLISLKKWLDKIQDNADESILQDLHARKGAIKNAFMSGF